MTVAQLLQKHAALWHSATHHRFLDGVRDGTLPRSAFERWLEQDYLFVATSFRAQALLVAQAPRADQALLTAGLSALASEQDWFEAHLQARGLDLAPPMHPVNRAYGDFLLVFAREPYPAALMVCAMAERAYQEAWSGTLPCAPAYAEFAARWTDPAFKDYVDQLAHATDRALAGATAQEQRRAEEAMVWTARYEAAFWQMTYEGSEA